MVAWRLYRRAAAERNALGRERDQLRIDVAVATARARRAEEDRDDLGAQVELLSVDNADLERVNAALVAHIDWPYNKRGGGR